MDLFESAHDLEERHIEEGFEGGRRDGMLAGLTEGRELGTHKGFEIGLEVGYYAGCARVWRALLDQQQQQQPASTAEPGLASPPDAPPTAPEAAAAAAADAGTSSSSSAPPAAPASAAPLAAATGSSAASAVQLSGRFERCIVQLEELLSEFPLYDPQDERLQDLMEQLRGRFKAAAAGLGGHAAAQYSLGVARPPAGGGGIDPSSLPPVSLSF